jgi:SH3 domain-containing protein
MAHIIYDSDQHIYNDAGDYNNHRSTGYYSPRINGGLAILVIVIVLILFFWVDLPRLRGNLNSVVIPEVENRVTRPNTDRRYVVADNLNLREEPINYARVNYILPRGTKVTLLGDSYQADDGGVWLKVSVETFEGIQVGWVSQRYIA